MLWQLWYLGAQKCSGLSQAHFDLLNTSNEGWDCKKCRQNMFPFALLNGKEMSKAYNVKNKVLPKVVSTRKLLRCSFCHNESRDSSGWNYVQDVTTNKKYTFCDKTCFHKFGGDTKNFEISNCSICLKEVGNVDSIFCDLCSCWVHRKCIKNLSHSEYEALCNTGSDWYCPPCQQNIFPFYNLDELSRVLSWVELS